MTAFDDDGPEEIEPWKLDQWGPGMTPDEDPVKVHSFKIGPNNDPRKCAGCHEMQGRCATMRGVRIGFSYNEVCDDCFRLLRQAME